jgi:pimeloyl-ACP methyl ester carboxylesterase
MKFVRGLAALAAAAGISVAVANDTRDAGALSVERFGTRGSPVVLVPGLASGAWVWKDTIDALKETHRVYAVTLAGFDGRAAVAGDPMRVALDALRDLVAYAQAALTLDFRTALAAIRVPVLAIVPYYASDYAAMGISEEAKRAYYASLLRGVARLEVVTIAPARHFAMLDQPEAFTTALRKFLDAP